MIPLGLRASELRGLNEALATHHQVRVRVFIARLDHTYAVDVSKYVIDGQVDVDASADVTRTASVKLLDVRRALPFDSDSPAETALFLDRLLRVSYDVLVGDEWVAVPVFTGPLSRLNREGDVVTVEAQGKEALAMGAIWRPLTLKKGMLKTDAIETILRNRAGETKLSIPKQAARLPKTISLHREAVAWSEARKIARGLSRQLFYDGRGTCRLRPWPGKTVYSFTGNTVVSELNVTYTSETVNTVWVVGGVPKGQKHHVSAVAVAPAAHPLSPQRLGRNGVPRYLLPDGKQIDEDTIKTVAEAKALAHQRLNDGLLETVECSFDALPIPHLEPGDAIYVHTDDGAVRFRLTTFSLPLVVGSPMTVGYNRRVSTRHLRRHR